MKVFKVLFLSKSYYVHKRSTVWLERFTLLIELK